MEESRKDFKAHLDSRLRRRQRRKELQEFQELAWLASHRWVILLEQLLPEPEELELGRSSARVHRRGLHRRHQRAMPRHPGLRSR